MNNFCVKSNGLEFIVTANSWYNAIQVAYEEYLRARDSSKLISYSGFRDYCDVSLIEENK